MIVVDTNVIGYLFLSSKRSDQAEQALQKAHDDLSNQMQERVRELREKEVLLKEVHHRVKNNLQVISSLVNLQASGSGDEIVREMLGDVSYRVRSMALVHEKLYQSADMARVEFAEYAESLLNYLKRVCNRLNISIDKFDDSVRRLVPIIKDAMNKLDAQ